MHVYTLLLKSVLAKVGRPGERKKNLFSVVHIILRHFYFVCLIKLNRIYPLERSAAGVEI